MRLAREVTYFHTRAAQIRYAAFRQERYPIGSGIVESGHKVVISPRFKRAGQHLLWMQQQETFTAARRLAQRQRQGREMRWRSDRGCQRP